MVRAKMYNKNKEFHTFLELLFWIVKSLKYSGVCVRDECEVRKKT